MRLLHAASTPPARLGAENRLAMACGGYLRIDHGIRRILLQTIEEAQLHGAAGIAAVPLLSNMLHVAWLGAGALFGFFLVQTLM